MHDLIHPTNLLSPENGFKVGSVRPFLKTVGIDSRRKDEKFGQNYKTWKREKVASIGTGKIMTEANCHRRNLHRKEISEERMKRSETEHRTDGEHRLPDAAVAQSYSPDQSAN